MNAAVAVHNAIEEYTRIESAAFSFRSALLTVSWPAQVSSDVHSLIVALGLLGANSATAVAWWNSFMADQMPPGSWADQEQAATAPVGQQMSVVDSLAAISQSDFH